MLRPLPVEHLMDFIEQSLFGAVLVHFSVSAILQQPPMASGPRI